jgi:tRNA U38,U39,U40 pseudouridine synthase TruA
MAFANKLDSQLTSSEASTITINPVRTIHSVSLARLPSDSMSAVHKITFHINSSLYRMIRNIVGMSMAVASDSASVSLERMEALLSNEEGKLLRSDNFAKPAPPQGLCLERVFYDHY